MESTPTLKTDQRIALLLNWLKTDCGLSFSFLQPMVGDASFRRYFRIQTKKGSFVVMDAPPTKENCHSFIAIAKTLREQGLLAPEIMAADLSQGFLLLSDFGEMTYLKALTSENADSLYTEAMNVLSHLQHIREVKGMDIPVFTADIMWQEWAWHKEWFLRKLLGLTPSVEEEKALDDCMASLIASANAQPHVFMYRDYHSANLMVLPEQQVGLLDFQDAFIGPVTYDLVSLLRDCYIDWPAERVQDWAQYYWQRLSQLGVLPNVSQQEFLHWFDGMGMQRHLKALLTFARKAVRDQQPHYLNYVPRTLHYLLTVSARYPEYHALHTYLQQTVQPAWAKVSAS